MSGAAITTMILGLIFFIGGVVYGLLKMRDK